ncbi:hypothetical protein [Methanolobus psychrotolerans]|uniref:hypothetical protein n=1 Tax=Methanolobus psychrotolerans TaxID=1874706 RepID=UPI00101AE331|nr:hypothetical protein [Methanolobus psychrotolerans]
MVDGKPAVVGTEVAIVVDGNVIGETTVTTEGVIGDKRGNRLGIPTGYDLVKVYVDGVEAQTLDLKNYQSGEAVSLDISATVLAEEKPVSSSTSGGGGGYISVATTEQPTEEDTFESVPDVADESTLSSTIDEVADEVVNDEADDGGYSPVTGVNGMLAILGLILVGIIVVHGYRSKNKAGK